MKLKQTLKEVSFVFFNAAKETPREMFAPVIAAWDAIKKRTIPEEYSKECYRGRDRRTQERRQCQFKKNDHHPA
jgi:hypothetical protein